MAKSSGTGVEDRVRLRDALEAFKKADAGQMSPGELAGFLREVLSNADSSPAPVWGELRDFVALDLSDYAYSLAIHDQPALDCIRDQIGEWVKRLEREAKKR